MRIEDVIRSKGDSSVATIAPTATVGELVRVLTEKRIGALVVSSDGLHIEGIVSERDVVRGLAELGADVINALVTDLMTADVHTTEPAGSVEEVAQSMTNHRVRHMPVLVNGQLVGLVSIGDVVKQRIAQLQDEREQLIRYLQS